jgi:hypothetical protein
MSIWPIPVRPTIPTTVPAIAQAIATLRVFLEPFVTASTKVVGVKRVSLLKKLNIKADAIPTQAA